MAQSEKSDAIMQLHSEETADEESHDMGTNNEHASLASVLDIQDADADADADSSMMMEDADPEPIQEAVAIPMDCDDASVESVDVVAEVIREDHNSNGVTIDNSADIHIHTDTAASPEIKYASADTSKVTANGKEQAGFSFTKKKSSGPGFLKRRQLPMSKRKLPTSRSMSPSASTNGRTSPIQHDNEGNQTPNQNQTNNGQNGILKKYSPSAKEQLKKFKPSMARPTLATPSIVSEKRILLQAGPADALPTGWTIKHYKRTTGLKHTDRYWFSPLLKKKFRSLAQVGRFLDFLEKEDVKGDEAKAWELFRSSPPGPDEIRSRNRAPSAPPNLKKKAVTYGILEPTTTVDPSTGGGGSVAGNGSSTTTTTSCASAATKSANHRPWRLPLIPSPGLYAVPPSSIVQKHRQQQKQRQKEKKGHEGVADSISMTSNDAQSNDGEDIATDAIHGRNGDDDGLQIQINEKGYVTPSLLFDQAIYAAGLTHDKLSEGTYQGSSIRRTVDDMFNSNIVMEGIELVPKDIWNQKSSRDETKSINSSDNIAKEIKKDEHTFSDNNGEIFEDNIDDQPLLKKQRLKRNDLCNLLSQFVEDEEPSRHHQLSFDDMIPTSLTLGMTDDFVARRKQYYQDIRDREEILDLYRRQKEDNENKMDDHESAMEDWKKRLEYYERKKAKREREAVAKKELQAKELEDKKKKAHDAKKSEDANKDSETIMAEERKHSENKNKESAGPIKTEIKSRASKEPNKAKESANAKDLNETSEETKRAEKATKAEIESEAEKATTTKDISKTAEESTKADEPIKIKIKSEAIEEPKKAGEISKVKDLKTAEEYTKSEVKSESIEGLKMDGETSKAKNEIKYSEEPKENCIELTNESSVQCENGTTKKEKQQRENTTTEKKAKEEKDKTKKVDGLKPSEESKADNSHPGPSPLPPVFHPLVEIPNLPIPPTPLSEKNLNKASATDMHKENNSIHRDEKAVVKHLVAHLDPESFEKHGRYYGLLSNAIADPQFVGPNAPGISGANASGGTGLATTYTGSAAVAERNAGSNSSYCDTNQESTPKKGSKKGSKTTKGSASKSSKAKKTKAGPTPTNTSAQLKKIMEHGGKLANEMRESIIRAAVYASRTASHSGSFIGSTGETFPDISKAFSNHARCRPCARCKNNKQGAYHCRLKRKHTEADYDDGSSAEILSPFFAMPLKELVPLQEKKPIGK